MTPDTTVIVVAAEPTTPRVAVLPDQTQSTASRFAPGQRVPLTLSRAQVYYWQHEWQQGERAALADLAAGRRNHFDSDDPEDAARWLAGPDDAHAG